jgi:hypothetical protein
VRHEIGNGIQCKGTVALKNISFVGSKLLGHAFDDEFSEMIEDIVLKDGIKHYKAHLSDIEEENSFAKAVVTDKGDKIEEETPFNL